MGGIHRKGEHLEYCSAKYMHTYTALFDSSLLFTVYLLIHSPFQPAAPPAVKSFLSCTTSPAKQQNQSERVNELKQRLEEKDRKVKEFELLKQKEHKDKFK